MHNLLQRGQFTEAQDVHTAGDDERNRPEEAGNTDANDEYITTTGNGAGVPRT